MSAFHDNAIFWIETEKIKPNPFQPRREFNEEALQDLSESIRMYGVLQPLVVTRKEIIRDDGGLTVEYELISGERRLRASKIASLAQVPVLIRTSEEGDRMKLELAIIENLQREDLNAVDRAYAFRRLIDEFSFKQADISSRVGKSREYVSNTIRILMLPPHILDALSQGEIMEGHTRPLLMLVDRPAEQETLFKEITLKRLNVREAEQIARRIAVEKVRKKELIDPDIVQIEKMLAETLGTRVIIERKEKGGRIHIEFFSNDDLRNLVGLLGAWEGKLNEIALRRLGGGVVEVASGGVPTQDVSETAAASDAAAAPATPGGEVPPQVTAVVATILPKENPDDNPDLYSIKNFSI